MAKPASEKIKGIEFVIDDKGSRKVILIGLKKHAQLWEDIDDSLVARQRANKPREFLEPVKKRLRRQGKPSG
ncbi:MAG: hypothetical protein HY644_12585 [Acidobacteria bacterium]|nr:hypothetical protein [Acidobacteriota bacterium]